jgi:hypothetical protein
MNNELFGFLTSRNIFRDNGRYTISGERIAASEKTELKRREKLRGKYVWLSKNIGMGAGKRNNMGTFTRKQPAQ